MKELIKYIHNDKISKMMLFSEHIPLLNNAWLCIEHVRGAERGHLARLRKMESGSRQD